jgi:rubrerythrin
MDLSDNFISYDDEFYIKQEKLSDHDISLGSPFSGDTESTALYPISIPTNLHNLLNNSEPLHDPYGWNNEHTVKKYQPFQIIKMKKEETNDSIQVKVEPEDKIINRTKRILKREKAKERTKTKSDTKTFLTQVSSKYIPEGFNDPTLDDKTKKKMIQMIRNRISAQNSRDRKKAYVNHLESLKYRLQEDTQKVYQDKSMLLQEYKKLEEAHAKLLLEHEELKKNRSFVCSQCGHEEGQTNSEGEFGLSSPSNISRITNNSKSFFSYAFAFATIISCVLIMNINNGQYSLPGTYSQVFFNNQQAQLRFALLES